VRLRDGEGPGVFVIPGGGGDGEDLFVARRLARLSGGERPFYVLRSGPTRHPPLAALADHLPRKFVATFKDREGGPQLRWSGRPAAPFTA